LKFGSENQLNLHNYLSTGTPKRLSMTGHCPLPLQKKGNEGSGAFLMTLP